LIFCIVNWLTECLFQLEALGDGDDTAPAATTQGEPSDVEEIAEGQTQADIPQGDAEDDVDDERAEV
jgi:hypothetical protein